MLPCACRVWASAVAAAPPSHHVASVPLASPAPQLPRLLSCGAPCQHPADSVAHGVSGRPVGSYFRGKESQSRAPLLRLAPLAPRTCSSLPYQCRYVPPSSWGNHWGGSSSARRPLTNAARRARAISKQLPILLNRFHASLYPQALLPLHVVYKRSGGPSASHGIAINIFIPIEGIHGPP